MAFFMVIGCSWLVIAGMMLWAHRRGEDPMTGQWRSEPSTFFGGPQAEAKGEGEAKGEAKSGEEPPSIAAGGPAPVPAATGA